MESGDGTGSLIDWAVASSPHPEATASGDAYVIDEVGPIILVGAVDGLGHGPEAAAAATRAVQVLEAHRAEPLRQLINRCDEALRGTRGVAMSLARLDSTAEELTWLGVGNVEGLLLPGLGGPMARQSLLLQGGVVGSRLPSIHEARLPLARGALMVFATDGIRSSFGEACRATADLQGMTRDILARFSKHNDDALVLAVRYLGAAA